MNKTLYVIFSVIRWLVISFSGLVVGLTIMGLLFGSTSDINVGTFFFVVIFVVVLLFQIRATKKYNDQ